MIHLRWVIVMEKILLVEPNYKNKYPPVGLMKIATYYKEKGDSVDFRKGIIPADEAQCYDRVLITTLFTFDFDNCIATIQYYVKVLGVDKVYVGGIAATIMPGNFLAEIPDLHLIKGQLYTSNLLGYQDNVNIDILELDYDILWDIEYQYPMEDSYFIYTSRGCIRQCEFCAVRILEPQFIECNNVEEQVLRVERKYGVKRNLLVMDNNILHSSVFQDVVDTLVKLGFGKENNKIQKCNVMRYYLNSLKERVKTDRGYTHLLTRIKSEFKAVNQKRVKREYVELLQEYIAYAAKSRLELARFLIENEERINIFFDHYFYHKISRYVDFNQGLDARLFDDDKAQLLSRLALRPCRIAFDNLRLQNEYFAAMELAYKHGIRNFSNYLLYNFKDTPEDLWQRLYLNVQFGEKHTGTKLFSFPMKYAAIDRTDRDYVGKAWNKKFLRAINVILNVTKGVVAKERDFFERAYGKNEEEFIRILTMPDEFIRNREFFDETGLIALWNSLYDLLSEREKQQLIDILVRMVGNQEVLDSNYSETINRILPLYKLTKFKVENNRKYFEYYILAEKAL